MTHWNDETEWWWKKQKIAFWWTQKPKHINRSSCRSPFWPFCHFSALFRVVLGLLQFMWLCSLLPERKVLFCSCFACSCVQAMTEKWIFGAGKKLFLVFSWFPSSLSAAGANKSVSSLFSSLLLRFVQSL